MLGIFDRNNTGDIDFGEFVLTLWNYCTLTKDTLAMFAFDMYDSDSSGNLKLIDLENMMRELYGPSYEENPATKLYVCVTVFSQTTLAS